MGKFYAVHKGRTPGIYKTWDECKMQVQGFKGCVYKSFSNKLEAEKFERVGKSDDEVTRKKVTTDSTSNTEVLEHQDKTGIPDEKTLLEIFGDSVPLPQKNKRKFVGSTTLLQCSDVKKRKLQHSSTVGDSCKEINGVSFSVDRRGNPIVYTDGACSGNGKKNCSVKAGYGVWWGDNHPWNLSHKLRGIQTNQRAEIAAVNACIKQAVEKDLKVITIRTDSMFIVNCVTKWMHSWVKNNWVKSDGKQVTHKSELLAMMSNLRKVDVNWEHVRGHQGIYGNEMADKLAVRGAKT